MGTKKSVFNTGTLFRSEIDIDYAKITKSLTVRRMTTNYATVKTSISAPYFDCSKSLNTANVTVGKTSMSKIGGNFTLDKVQILLCISK